MTSKRRRRERREGDASEPNHPITQAVIDALVPGPSEAFELPPPVHAILVEAIDGTGEAHQLAVAAEELLYLAMRVDEKHGAARTADKIAGLADHAAQRAIALKGALSGDLDRVNKVGEQYERFIGRKKTLPGVARPELPPKAKTNPVMSLADLDPKRRV